MPDRILWSAARTLAATLLLTSCAASSTQQPAHPAHPSSQPVHDEIDPAKIVPRDQLPAELQAALANSEKLGVQLFQQDRAAWRATDAAREKGWLGPPIQGWITEPLPVGWLVRFVTPCGAGTCALVDVEVPGRLAPTVKKLDPPAPLSPEEEAMFAARTLAVTSEFRACTENYNTAVLSGERDGEPVWVVYLLAASTEENELVLTGHHRITVSGDGKKILEARALSKSCVVIERKADQAALMLTHILDPYPIETHVFTSLNYGLPLFVGTESGTFAVEGATIQMLKR